MCILFSCLICILNINKYVKFRGFFLLSNVSKSVLFILINKYLMIRFPILHFFSNKSYLPKRTDQLRNGLFWKLNRHLAHICMCNYPFQRLRIYKCFYVNKWFDKGVTGYSKIRLWSDLLIFFFFFLDFYLNNYLRILRIFKWISIYKWI